MKVFLFVFVVLVSCQPEGIELKNIAVPLPDNVSLNKYKKDMQLKKELQPYQLINPFGLKKYCEEV